MEHKIEISDKEWRILCIVNTKRFKYINLALIQIVWIKRENNRDPLQQWYKPLRSLVDKGLLNVYVEHCTPDEKNPNLFDVSYMEVQRVDFRRRMYFRPTRSGWAAIRNEIKKGRRQLINLPEKNS